MFRPVPPYMGNNRLFILCESQPAAQTVYAFRMAIAVRVRKFCEKHIRFRRFRHHMAENDIRHTLQQCKHKKRPRQVPPKILFHNQIPFLIISVRLFQSLYFTPDTRKYPYSKKHFRLRHHHFTSGCLVCTPVLVQWGPDIKGKGALSHEREGAPPNVSVYVRLLLSLRSLLIADSFKCSRPGYDIIDHFTKTGLMDIHWFKFRHILEVIEQAESALRLYCGHFQVCQGRTQCERCRNPKSGPIGYNTCCFVMPLRSQVVQMVLKSVWQILIVFRCHENEAVTRINFSRPGILFIACIFLICHQRRNCLIETSQPAFLYIYDFKFCIYIPVLRKLLNPLCNLQVHTYLTC